MSPDEIREYVKGQQRVAMALPDPRMTEWLLSSTLQGEIAAQIAEISSTLYEIKKVIESPINTYNGSIRIEDLVRR